MTVTVNQCSRSEGSSAGFALLVVIVVMLLASFLASQLILEVQTELKIAHNLKKRTVERFLAEAGIKLGLFRLVDVPQKIEDLKDEKAEIFLHGRTYEESALSAGKFLYYVVNESGKIDLNKSDLKLMELFLQHKGLDTEHIYVVIDSLQDWRDGDDLHRLNGAESEYYKELAKPYVARNGNVEDPTEFFLIKGTEELAGHFLAHEVFTVKNVSGDAGKISFNNLTPAMLDFLTEGSAEKKVAYQELQDQVGVLDSTQARLILGDERYEVLQPFLSFKESPGRESNSFYTVVGVGYAAAGEEEQHEKEGREPVPGTRISAIVEKVGAGFTFRAWKEDTT